MRKTWTTRLACAALVMVTLTGVAVAAGSQGSREDPLVTLSYLNDVVLPDLLKQVDEKLAGQGGESSAASFATVTVKGGQTVELSAGAQLLPRNGGATSADVLTDLTDGGDATGALAANHLYLATADGQAVTVGSDSTLMILGSYTVK